MAEHEHPGRPPIFSTPESFEKAVDEYIAANPDSMTITGLAMWLGFESRQSFYDYEKRPEYSYIVKKGRLAVENAYERGLRSQSVTGSIFALKNMGWKDTQRNEITGADGAALQPPVINISVVKPENTE